MIRSGSSGDFVCDIGQIALTFAMNSCSVMPLRDAGAGRACSQSEFHPSPSLVVRSTLGFSTFWKTTSLSFQGMLLHSLPLRKSQNPKSFSYKQYSKKNLIIAARSLDVVGVSRPLVSSQADYKSPPNGLRTFNKTARSRTRFKACNDPINFGCGNVDRREPAHTY